MSLLRDFPAAAQGFPAAAQGFPYRCSGGFPAAAQAEQRRRLELLLTLMLPPFPTSFAAQADALGEVLPGYDPAPVLVIGVGSEDPVILAGVAVQAAAAQLLILHLICKI